MNIFTMTTRLGNALLGLIKAILSVLGYILRAVYQYKYLFLVFAAIAISYSLYEAREDNHTYEGYMQLRLNDGDAILYKSLIHDLNDYALKEDPEGLAQQLDLPIETAIRIVKFDAHPVIDKYRDTTIDYIDYKNKAPLGDTIEFAVPNQLVISARIKGIEEFAIVQKALINYFSNNKYLESMNISRLKLLEEKEWMFHNALMNLDSLQKVDFFKNPSGNILEFSSINEKKAGSTPFIKSKKQMYYDDMKKIFKITEEIESDLAANLEVVTVLSDFHPAKEPVNSFKKLILFRGAIALVIFMIIALLLNYRKQIKAYLEKGM